MKLKELNLISFGKFKNKVINLDDGLNIIYGENESGKTTIHNFIEGMFYGFLKPYATRRNFLEELNKYRPWDRDQYSGTLTLQKDGKIYRIERDFSREEVKVYDDETGKDITDDIDTGEKLKIHIPGLHFFGFNCLVYRNTIAVKQLGNKVDSQLAKEVNDRLANISTSMDDEISVKNAILNLNKQLDSIGKEKAYTKDYGKAIKKLDSLKEKKRIFIEKKEEYNITAEKYISLKKEIEEKKSQIENLRLILKKADILNMKKTYEDALSIKNKIDEIDENIEKLKPYANLSKEDYYLLLELDSEIKVIDGEIENLLTRIKSIDVKLEGLKVKTNDRTIEGIKSDEFFDDFSLYTQMEEEKTNLSKRNEESNIGILSLELKGMNEKRQKSKFRFTVSLILTIAFLGLFVINKYLPVLSVVSGALAIYSFLANKKLDCDIESIEKEINSLKLKENEIYEKINNIERLKNDILKKYNCSNKAELNRLYDDLRFAQININSILKEIDELNEEKKKAGTLVKSKVSLKEELTGKIAETMKRNNVESIEDLKKGLDKKNIYDNLVKDKENKLELLDRILSSTSLEELEAKLADYDAEYFESEINVNIDGINNDIKLKEEELSQMREEYSRLEERIDNLNNYVLELINIEEEIDRTEKEIENMDNKKKSIQIAIEVIEKVSERIHSQFAPQINKEVSELIKKITNERYTNIKIDDKLGISVENPNTREIVPLDSLSGGTIDQIHFSLRYSIINSMEKENFPLILDDCFIQYDDTRLENILRYLDEISDNVQILLFTCHNREKDILDRLNLKYNFINIS